MTSTIGPAVDVLFLPQFYTPAAIRIGHGLLVAVGSAWLALALWRSSKADSSS